MERLSSSLLAHLWPHRFKNPEVIYPYNFGCIYLIGLQINPSIDGQQKISLGDTLNNFQIECHTWVGKTAKMGIDVKRITSKVLLSLGLSIESDYPEK